MTRATPPPPTGEVQAGSFDPGEQVVELVLGVLALVWLWPGGMPPLGLDKMHASSPDPGVQVIELPLVDGVVEGWPCPGATPPPAKRGRGGWIIGGAATTRWRC